MSALRRIENALAIAGVLVYLAMWALLVLATMKYGVNV